MDLTGTGRIHGAGLRGAEKVARQVACRFGLRYAGFASSTLAARLASVLCERFGGGLLAVPDSLHSSFMSEVALATLPSASGRHGRLAELGVRTIGELRVVPVDLLRAVFGATGLLLAAEASGLGAVSGREDRPGGQGREFLGGVRLVRPVEDGPEMTALLRGLARRALVFGGGGLGRGCRLMLIAIYAGGGRGQAESGGPEKSGWSCWPELLEGLWNRLNARRCGVVGMDLFLTRRGSGSLGEQPSLFREDREDVALAGAIRKSSAMGTPELTTACEHILAGWGARWLEPGAGGLVDGRGRDR